MVNMSELESSFDVLPDSFPVNVLSSNLAHSMALWIQFVSMPIPSHAGLSLTHEVSDSDVGSNIKSKGHILIIFPSTLR